MIMFFICIFIAVGHFILRQQNNTIHLQTLEGGWGCALAPREAVILLKELRALAVSSWSRIRDEEPSLPDFQSTTSKYIL